MMDYRTLDVSREDGVLRVSLNRPEVHNAFNDALIAEAIDLFEGLEREPARAVVLTGSGPNFCAGADLNWMARMVDYSREENIRDASLLAKMFAVIDDCPVPVVGRINGSAIGGGVGLVAVCDVAIASAGSKFGLSEVKLGILPAVISPHVIGKIGSSHARALFLTGERFGAERAEKIGLIHRIAADEQELDQLVEETVKQLRSSAPGAVRECKQLIRHVSSVDRSESIPYTIEAIAERRTTEEGQTGMRAFLEKKKAPWVEAP
jgi:methylglutaconyl-CoA hydratase